MRSLLFIILTILISSAAQIVLKTGMLKVGPVTFASGKIWSEIGLIFTNFYIFAGLILAAIAMVLWIAALSMIDLGYAFSLTSVMYIIIFIAAYLFFNEPITLIKFIGVILISGGVFLIVK